MTIKEVCEKYDISANTLRYYEKAGVIPPVTRTSGGVRNYSKDDIQWVENAICMRSAGLPVETLTEYVRLFQMGDKTIQERRELLMEARRVIVSQLEKYQVALSKLDFKISRYDEALETGVLRWDEPKEDCIIFDHCKDSQ